MRYSEECDPFLEERMQHLSPDQLLLKCVWCTNLSAVRVDESFHVH